MGNEDNPLFQCGIKSKDGIPAISDESSPKKKCSHCSFCGHPGSKRAHFKSSCEYCGTTSNESCIKKLEGFKCNCPPCLEDREEKEQKKQEDWWIRICEKITVEKNFPNDEIIGMYLCDNHGKFAAEAGPSLSWEHSNTDMIVDFLWVKMRYGHQFFVVKWKKATSAGGSLMCTVPVEEYGLQQEQFVEASEPIDLLDESIEPQIHVDGGYWLLLTDEAMDLVHSAFPEETARFLLEKLQLGFSFEPKI
ncbi:hypothetical protein SLA2020_348820 [Shorea laevis]